MDHTFKVASIQFNPKLNEREENVDALYSLMKEAAEQGAKLIVTPEMATTGYHYADRRAISPAVDTIPGKTTHRFSGLAKEFQAYLVIGMPEVDSETGIYYNAAALIGPEGYVGKYRKTHLWETEERWSAWGDLGIPVFSTELGRIAINICMDSIYFESARIPAIQGADILVFLTNSTAQTIALLQSRAESNGLYIVSANRSNTENGYHMVGASAVWSPYGEKLAETALIPTPEQSTNEPCILYADINPAHYGNQAKKRLAERRPELYQDLMLYVGPWDSQKTVISQEVVAGMIQYEPAIGNKDENLFNVERLMRSMIETSRLQGQPVQLVVLPELSFIGPLNQVPCDEIQEWAEPGEGWSYQQVRRWAVEYQIYIVYGWIELEEDLLYNSAALVNPLGERIGTYRKTHLSEADQPWAAAGDEIRVFPTELGSIGLMIGYDACFPETAGVLAAKRADIIVIPSSWHGEYGREMNLPEGMSAHPYPKGSLTTWNAIAMGAQAYTLVANFAGGNSQNTGQSGLYTLDPLYGLDQPVIASNQPEGIIVKFSTLANHWWFNQEKLILSRRRNLYQPLILT